MQQGMSHWLGLAAAPSALFSTLNASPFDVIILRCINHEDSLITVLELVPSTSSNTPKNIENSSEDLSRRKDCFELYLHPILAEYLTVSSLVLEETNSDETVNQEEDDSGLLAIENDYTAEGSDCVVVTFNYNDPSVPIEKRPRFCAKRIEIHEADSFSSQEVLHVTVRCLGEESMYGYDGPEEISTLKDDSFKDALKERMEGRFVIQGGILAVNLPFVQHGIVYDKEHIVFMLVEDVRLTFPSAMGNNTNASSIQGGGNEEKRNGTKEQCCYHLGRSETFSVTFLDDGKNTSCPFEESRLGKTIQGNESIGDQMGKDSLSCLGYESLLSELLSLARIDDRRAFPSAVLLTGSAGVGKTHLASCLIRNLMLPSTLFSTIVQHISARDIILTASSSLSNSSILLDYILPKNILQNMRSNVRSISKLDIEGKRYSKFEPKTLKFTRVVLVLDDIDVLIDPDRGDLGGSGMDFQDTERASALDAIGRAISTLKEFDELMMKEYFEPMMATAPPPPSPPPFILGLCRSQPSQLPSELMRVGRFEKVLTMSPPTQLQREQILESLFMSLPISPQKCNPSKETSTINRWIKALAPQTAGCVASDLRRICADALILATSRLYSCRSDGEKAISVDDHKDLMSCILSETRVTWKDVREAARNCIPSQLAQLDVSVSRFVGYDDEDLDPQSLDFETRFELSWKSFGGYDQMKARLNRTVVRPWRRHIAKMGNGSGQNMLHMEIPSSSSARCTEATNSSLEISPPPGVLFHGPPGCGKTMAAHCLASCLGFHVVKVKASDVLDKWLGGSEAAIRSLFSRARAAAPCILFFDEMDSLATNREEDSDGSSDVHSRVLSTFLNEMDGISNSTDKCDVLVVAATNRLHAIDAALLRPGRLQEHVLLSLPMFHDCLEILKLLIKSFNLNHDVDCEELAAEFYELGASGADIEGVCREACLSAIRRGSTCFGSDDVAVSLADFKAVIDQQIK